MSSLDALLRDLGSGPGRTSQPAGEDHTWNIMVQVLLPLVFVLTFVVITGLMAYKAAWDAMREVMAKDGGYAEIEAKERLVEAQLEKLLRALEEVKAERRTELRVAQFPAAGRVTRRGVQLADADFRVLCHRTTDIFDAGAPSARFTFADEIYRQVLIGAEVHDPSPLRVQRWSERTSEAQEAVDTAQTMSAQKGVIVAANRRLLHNAILDFLDGLEEQVVELQVELMEHVFEELLASASFEALDPTSTRILAQILDHSTPETERRRAADQLYRDLLGRWRSRFEKAGYPFLDRTWRAVLG